MLLLVGVAATLTAFLALRTAEINDAERLFAAWSGERRDLLQKEIDAHVQILRGLRALFDSSEEVSVQEFNKYTDEFFQRHPQMYSLDWMPSVKATERTTFEASASQTLGIPYRILERADDSSVGVAAERNEYRPLLYSRSRDWVTPLGLDLLKRPSNKLAMERAVESNEPTAVRLPVNPREAEQITRAFVYLPVFKEHSKELEGFVRTSISIDEMLKAMLKDAEHDGVVVTIADQIAKNEQEGIVGWRGAGLKRLYWHGRLKIADVHVGLTFVATHNYREFPRLAPMYALLIAGLLVTLLGSIAVYHLTRRRMRMQALTNELMEENAERRQSEQRLSRSEARYRVLVENSPDAILLHHQGRIMFVNKAGTKLLGFESYEDLLGKSVFDLVHPDHHDTIRKRIRAMTETREVLESIELSLVRADGATVPVELIAIPFETEVGLVIQATARDITQRRAVESERQKLEAALRHSQKLEALGTLAGGIAHDFNNILSAIIGNARLLSEDLPNAHPAARSVREILNAAHRARDLVKRVAAFSQQQESQRTAVAVAPLIVEIQQLLRASLPAGIEIITRVPPSTPSILGDATEIHQVLLNLCTNAWQSMASSTGRIEIDVTTFDEAQIRERVAAPIASASRYVCIGVHDNGSGMSPEVMEHIFDPFFTTKRSGENSGLGLAVVHGIVQGHHGAITVKSRPNEGTSFYIYLPSCDVALQVPDAAPRKRTLGAAQHVLYIDDEESLVFLVVRMLERAGYRCTGMDRASDAVELVRRAPENFDFVVTDLNMPGMNGLDVAQEMHAIRPDLPVLIMTGYVRADDVAAARALGVCDIVLKPDTIEELASVVQLHLKNGSSVHQAAAVGGRRD